MDWTGTTTFELDLLGRLQKMTDHKGNTVSYTYDEVGNQTGITYPDGSKTSNSYDVVNNLIGVVDAENGTYTYVYDEANRPIKLTYPNGWVEQYTYDAEGNLLKTVDTDPFQLYNKTPKVKYEYTYDAEGNVLTKFQRDSDATEGLKTRTTYTYDTLNRLTGSVRRPEASAAGTLSYTYTYDSLGNLLRQTGPAQGEEDTYQYNDLNQMVSKHVCGYEQKVTRIHDYGYTYDKRGNLVKEEEICSPTTTGPKNITIATYLYDETNRMVRGTNANGEVSGYTFNGLGVRVGTELILQDNSHGYTDFHSQTPSVETDIEKPEVVKTDYVIDYTRLGIDQRVLMKSEEGGYDFRYTYGREKLKVFTTGEGSDWWGQNVKQCVNAAYVHTDLLGSVVNLSDQYGRVTARTDYTDWGELRRTTDITVNGGFRRLLPEITYATHEYDDVLNQFYAKARMYDAENKRFTAGDSILDPSKYDLREYVTDPMQLVQYLYVKDNAVNAIDPFGLKNVSLRELAEKYGASVTYQGATSYRGARAKVTINGTTKYYTATSLDGDHAFINSSHTMMYVDDDYFYEQWGIFSSDTQYGIIDQAEMDAFENFEMAPASYTYLMRLTYAWYLADSAQEQDTLRQEANLFRGTGYSKIYFDSILCIDEETWNAYIDFMPSIPSGELTKEQHYFRNNLNIELNWSMFEQLNERLPEELKWSELPWYKSVFHKFGQINNRKYVSSDGHFEMVFTKENYLVNEKFSATNMGTYNYYGPNQDASLHKRYDVDTWLKWGNVPR